MKLWQIAVVSASMGIGLPALAQMAVKAELRSDVEANVKERLGKFDTNKDGVVSPEEMRAYADARMKARADEQFAAMDTDKNGVISRAEFDAYRAKGREMGDRMVMMERMHGPDGMMPPPPPGGPDGPPPPMPPGPDGAKRAEHIHMMLAGRGGRMMAQGDGKGIVIADAVKSALARFDAVDTNKDGSISPEERKAAREAMKARMHTMMTPPPPKVG